MKYLRKLQINEGVSDTYKKNIIPDLEHFGIYYNGNEVDDITCNEISVWFTIEIDAREWGIKDIAVYNFKGPSELALHVNFYANDNDDLDPVEEEIIIPLDWTKVEVEKSDKQGGITVDGVRIELSNEKSGGMSATSKGDIRNTGKIVVNKLIVITNEI